MELKSITLWYGWVCTLTEPAVYPPVQIKPWSFEWIETELFFLPGVDASHVYVGFWALHDVASTLVPKPFLSEGRRGNRVPPLTFRHLPPNSARFDYAIRFGFSFISLERSSVNMTWWYCVCIGLVYVLTPRQALLNKTSVFPIPLHVLRLSLNLLSIETPLEFLCRLFSLLVEQNFPREVPLIKRPASGRRGWHTQSYTYHTLSYDETLWCRLAVQEPMPLWLSECAHPTVPKCYALQGQRTWRSISPTY